MVYRIVLSFCLLFFWSSTPNDELMTWHPNLKLEWKNFRGKPQPNTNAVAVTASGITFEYSVKETGKTVLAFTAKVKTHFYPKRSWYVKERANDYILAHEQLHFDITELHARKFRKQIEKLKVSNHIREDLQQLHQSINKQLADMQNLYDTESNNSINKEQQDKWAAYVKKELSNLDAYSYKD